MPKKNIKNQEEVWNKIAEKWNDFRETPSPSVIHFLKDKKGKILDLGCGSGRNFSAINNKKESKVYALDFSDKMLQYAGANGKKLGLKIEIVKSKSWQIPFEDNFFDFIICSALLHCIGGKENRFKTIKEIYRTLKPEGLAFISVWGRKSPRLKNKPKECYIPWTVKSQKEFRKPEQDEKQERYTYIYDLEELEKEILKAGFQIEKEWEERNINFIVRK
jgi:ubiquinone/menaquinone biosynthesis C-methylase UbiE